MNPTPGLRIALLGSPRLQRADGSLHALERRDAALLALLALDGPTHRARAARLLWPDLSEKQARSNLRQRLFRLRQTAQRELVDSTTLLRLLDDVTLDLAQIHHLIAADPSAAQGELLGNHDYSDNDLLDEWAQQVRSRWRTTRLNLLAQVASDLEAKQQIAAALPYAERMVADDPLLEHAHRRLMRLHYLRGDRAAALAAFERCRAGLRSELGAAPNQETLKLAALVEASGALPQAAPAPRPIAALRPPRLVGREPQWQALARAHDAGIAALVEGEPGIGKTRLISDFALAHGDSPVFRARPGDAQLPYAVLGRLVNGVSARFGQPAALWARHELARIAPGLGPAAVGKLEPRRLQQAVLQAIGEWRAAGLTLLVIDDLHFADAGTLDMLPALAGAPGPADGPCLFGVRSNERPPAVQAWIDAREHSTVARVALGPLELAAVRALLDSLAIDGLDVAAWAGPLARHTGGNPLFILETLIALLDHDSQAMRQMPQALPAPAPVGELIERRLGQLSAPALKLARVAAIAGQDFNVELASAVLGQHALDIADQWRELEAAQVIRDDAFAHDLIFEATLRTVPEVIERVLHREIAVHLHRRAAPPARIAAHWERAQEWAAAGLGYESAARAAHAASQHADEATHWAHATACHERSGDGAAAFRSRCASVKPVMASRPLEEAQALTERLLSDARSDEQRLDALIERTTLLLVQVNGAAALATGSQALDLARRLRLPWREFDAARGTAVALALSQRGAEGVELLGRHQALVEAQGAAQQRFDYWSDMAFVLADAGRRRDSAQAWQAAADHAGTLGDRHEMVTCTSNRATLLVQLGYTEEAYDSAQRARRLHAEMGHDDDIVACMADMNVASFGLLLGQYGEALGLFASALERLRKAGAANWTAACEGNLASAWLQMGQTARALQTLQPLASDVTPSLRARRLVIEGRIERAMGRTALPRLREALALYGERGDDFMRTLAALDETRELEPGVAAARCRHYAQRAEELEMLGVAQKARLFEIDALLRNGDASGAAACAGEVRARLAQCRPVDMHWPEVPWLLAQAFEANGDDALAAEQLQAAAHWLREEALQRVPEPFRDAFLHRQPVNQAVLAMADRLRAR
jgi:DNA-binding SARP family transcriptional activator